MQFAEARGCYVDEPNQVNNGRSPAMTFHLRPRPTDHCTRYGHSDTVRLFLPLGNDPNKTPSPVRQDTYSSGAHMVFPS